MSYRYLSDKAAYMRNWRKLHQLTEAQRFKDNARSKAGVYKRRGLLKPLPCEDCATTISVEMHHIDYHYPLIVAWLCRPCHIRHHRQTADISSIA